MAHDPRAQLRADLPTLRELMQAEDYPQAEQVCRAILARQPRNAEALYHLGNLALRAGQEDQAADLLRQAISLQRNPLFYAGLANVLTAQGDDAGALEVVDTAIGFAPQVPDLYALRGQLLANLGREEEAREAYRRSLELEPGGAGPHYGLAMLSRYQSADDPHLTQMEALLDGDEISPEERAGLCFAAARAWHSIGDDERAWARWEEANRLKRAEVDYDAEQDAANARRLMETFTPELFEALRGVGHRSPRPVLIVGVPRSGSTLIEQILHAHPEVIGAGELMEFPRTVAQLYGRFAPPTAGELLDELRDLPREFYAAVGSSYEQRLIKLAGDAPRIVDKQLFNYTMIGLIHLALPEARFIHARRDPMDACFSCYMSNFKQDRGYVYDLEDLGKAYRIHEELIAHWHRVLPGVVHTVQYEQVVEDLEGEARKLIGFLGLGWDDACLDFHRQERVVRTHSLTQVRQPIYRSSMGRWRRYEDQLEPLKRALGDLYQDAS